MNCSQKTNDISFIYDKVKCVKLLFFWGGECLCFVSVLGRKVKAAQQMKVIRRTKDVCANGMQLGVILSCAGYARVGTL